MAQLLELVYSHSSRSPSTGGRGGGYKCRKLHVNGEREGGRVRG